MDKYCRDIERWGAQIGPKDEVLSPSLAEHAARCPRCAEALRTYRELDRILAQERALRLEEAARAPVALGELLAWLEAPRSRRIGPRPTWKIVACGLGAASALLVLWMLFSLGPLPRGTPGGSEAPEILTAEAERAEAARAVEDLASVLSRHRAPPAGRHVSTRRVAPTPEVPRLLLNARTASTSAVSSLIPALLTEERSWP